MLRSTSAPAPVQSEDAQSTTFRDSEGWSVTIGRGRITLRLPSRVTLPAAAAAIDALVTSLQSAAGAVVIVLDLLDVEEFDPSAPIAAIHLASHAPPLVERVDLLARNGAARAAAVSALNVLGVPFAVAESRLR